MISLNWVKDYINLDNVDLKQLAVEITKAGVNIEKVITNHINPPFYQMVILLLNLFDRMFLYHLYHI